MRCARDNTLPLLNPLAKAQNSQRRQFTADCNQTKPRFFVKAPLRTKNLVVGLFGICCKDLGVR